ncbi:hypothetical protein RM863_12625 [Streptomyces sp. DSM 41014]|uniref:Uncharacterized protein n=1 Tax=Streptomyces hintoniae TaxID=3075521 RepID=A0ABU2UI80_9ACTN|nr:hypothetical protein [Streptomyces sp. DSM 41014]MDT0472968.1 hypothetical protein [Streptomyces sp. DSM 41014]
MSETPMTPEQGIAIAELIGEARPATSALLVELAQSVKDRREHEHPTWEDLYCLNLVSWAGERIGPVLRRLLDTAAEAERLRSERSDREDGLSAAVGYTRGLAWSDLVGIAASNTTLLVQAERDVRRLRARVAELEAAPTTVYRAEHPDSGITLGHYGTEAAARAHCEATERRSWGPGHTLVFDWIEDDEDRVAELVVTAGQNEESTTGYIVTALELDFEYDEAADE